MKKLLLAFFAFNLVVNAEISAQQIPLSNFYNFNEYLINPAQAGYQNQIEGSLSHRIQWQGINGAPTTTFFGVHGALNESMGLGAKLYVDQTDILQQFNAALSYSYRVKLNEKAKLNFGISGMILQNSIQFSQATIKDEADNIINRGDQSGVTFDAEVGIMLEYGNGKLGISSSHLLESGVDYDIPEGVGTFERIRQFSLYGSQLFDLSKNWDVEPFILVRNQGVGSFQYEINTLTSWKQTLFLGAGYRQEAGFIGRIGFQIADKIIAAYAYEFSGTGIASYSNGSHEFMVGYQLAKPKKPSDIKEELSPNKLEAKTEEKVEPKLSETPKKIKEKKPVIEELDNSSIEKEVPKEIIKEEPSEVKEKKKEAKIVTPVEAEVKKTKITQVKKEIKQQTPIVSINKEEVPEKLIQTKIPFDFEKMNFSAANKSILDEIAEELKSHSNQKILIKGHTCNMGSDRVNRTISLQRAKAVQDYLISKKVSREQIQIKAMLDTEPLVPNTSLVNRKKNRRVEFEMIY